MATARETWKAFERVVAAKLSEVLGVVTTRTPLSGTNSRHGPGDVIIPQKWSMLVECKYDGKGYKHHRLMRDAQADATKHGIDTNSVFLCTKGKREQGFYVTISSETFFKMLAVRGVLRLFTKGKGLATGRRTVALTENLDPTVPQEHAA